MSVRRLGLLLSGAALVVVAACGDMSGSSGSGGDGKPSDQLPPEVAQAGEIIAADSGSVPPLKYIEEGSEEVVGLVPDLSAEYAERLGVGMRIEKVSGDAVVPGVMSSRFDVGLALGDFKERRETLDFIDLLRGGIVLVVKDGNPEGVGGPDDLCGRMLAIVKGSIQQDRADEAQAECEAQGKEPIDIQPYADGPAANLALDSGRVDVEWSDIAAANSLLKNNPGTYQFAGKPEWLAPYGIGIPKERPELRDAIKAVLDDMHADGTYHEILKKWGQENLALDKIEINGSKF